MRYGTHKQYQERNYGKYIQFVIGTILLCEINFWSGYHHNKRKKEHSKIDTMLLLEMWFSYYIWSFMVMLEVVTDFE